MRNFNFDPVLALGLLSTLALGSNLALAASPLDAFVGTWCGDLQIKNFDAEGTGAGVIRECWFVPQALPSTPSNVVYMSYNDPANPQQKYLARSIYSSDFTTYSIYSVDIKKAWTHDLKDHCQNSPTDAECIQAVDTNKAWYLSGRGGCDYTSQPNTCSEFYFNFDAMDSFNEFVYLITDPITKALTGFRLTADAQYKTDGKRYTWDGVLNKVSGK